MALTITPIVNEIEIASRLNLNDVLSFLVDSSTHVDLVEGASPALSANWLEEKYHRDEEFRAVMAVAAAEYARLIKQRTTQVGSAHVHTVQSIRSRMAPQRMWCTHSEVEKALMKVGSCVPLRALLRLCDLFLQFSGLAASRSRERGCELFGYWLTVLLRPRKGNAIGDALVPALQAQMQPRVGGRLLGEFLWMRWYDRAICAVNAEFGLRLKARFSPLFRRCASSVDRGCEVRSTAQ
ncbi:MAG: uncharacterized protein KVP18_004071 [Porospora cf. gigantea A]|uniref:uncharacterized protein n=1 Tax=Porospora cf. gigantea A TaxID=2853593 RepID=UPI00355A9415|nr:MAG: hypothetical protein KVP18_004071 [Porospora cf. gigantea A]